MNSLVALASCPTYDQAQVDQAVTHSLDLLGGIGRYVKPGDRVLLKCNLLVGAASDKAITTHPSICQGYDRLSAFGQWCARRRYRSKHRR